MFRSFFLNRKWLLWSVLGSLTIMFSIWYQVQLTVKINDWYGDLYNTIQKALSEPNAIQMHEFTDVVTTFLLLAAPWIVLQVATSFFTSHYVFRWRTAMNDYYMSHWPKLRNVEGAAQRVQEDTMRFASIVEGLGIHLFRSILTLIAFLPILVELSTHIIALPFFGPVEHSLVYVAIASALVGTLIVAIVGIKLPGLEFNNQLVEAAYRKELVYGEDYENRADPQTVTTLFAEVRKNYYRLYLHYGYFNFARFAYIQYSVMLPLIAMAPTIVAGAITFGIFGQIRNAFGQVEDSFQFLVNSWSTIVELISIYKRLHKFESNIKAAPLSPTPA
ncbi:MAG: putative transporter [Pseudomonadota bacterium]